MIDAADRAALADLAMRALDTIDTDYGEDADLVSATLVFEVHVPNADPDQEVWHGNYESLANQSPLHTMGLLTSTVDDIRAS